MVYREFILKNFKSYEIIKNKTLLTKGKSQLEFNFTDIYRHEIEIVS